MLRDSKCAGWTGWLMWRQWFQKAALLLVMLAGTAGLVLLGSGPAGAKTKPETVSGAIAVSQLPPQGRSMMELIYQGGPFRYDRDGSVFGNRERLLPARNRGFYREYTVHTPGETNRGARRIVCGGIKAVTPEACYYTDDHYASFRKIVH